MFEQAAGFAVLAALSPGALLVVTAYLRSASPRRTIAYFLAGAVVISVVAGIALVVALHASGLNHPHQRQPRYGLRLGIGVIAIGAGIALARRKARPPDPDKKKGLMNRLLNRPGPISAFAAGLVVFIPSAAFIAAVQTIGTAHADADSVAGALALVVVIDVMFAWLPLVVYLLAPDATARRIGALNSWLHIHRRVLLVCVLVLVGILLVADGAVGLATS